MRFVESFPDITIVPPLASQLSWSHFLEVILIKNNEKKENTAHTKV